MSDDGELKQEVRLAWRSVTGLKGEVLVLGTDGRGLMPNTSLCFSTLVEGNAS